MSVEDLNKMSVKEMAQLELRKERADEAKEKLKSLYSKLHNAEMVCKNIQREVDDYLMQLDDAE